MNLHNFSVVLCICLCSCMLLCGCQQRYNVHIAYGRFVSIKSESARYRIDNIERGQFLVKDYVDISFYPNSKRTVDLPINAILILEHPFFKHGCIRVNGGSKPNENEWLHAYDTLGKDAYRGIIEDTRENRALIKKTASRNLAYNDSKKMLSKTIAIELAKSEVSKRGDNKDFFVMKCETYRYNYGWVIYVDKETNDGLQFMSGPVIVTIGDDKQIKDYFYGD